MTLDYYPGVDEQEDPFLDSLIKEEFSKKEDARDFLEGVLECLYDSGNTVRLEGMLDELCHALDVPMRDGPLKVEKRRSDELMDWYLGYQKSVINRFHKDQEGI